MLWLKSELVFSFDIGIEGRRSNHSASEPSHRHSEKIANSSRINRPWQPCVLLYTKSSEAEFALTASYGRGQFHWASFDTDWL